MRTTEAVKLSIGQQYSSAMCLVLSNAVCVLFLLLFFFYI